MSYFQKTIIHTSVFQNGPNGGNPCPVVLDGEDLKAEHAKHLAATFGAETIIILNSKETDSDFRLRYFVPNYEMEIFMQFNKATSAATKNFAADRQRLCICRNLI